MDITWNPWHGCHKYSEGCANCYVFRIDSRFGKQSSVVTKTKDFDLPIKQDINGVYKVKPGSMVATCFSSDFFIEEADEWRPYVWSIIKRRSDLHFFFTTKRIERALSVMPHDWNGGYPNVTLCCTVENQDRADVRIPIFKAIPAMHKQIICEPLLGSIDLSPWLGDWAERVIAGGESGENARVCDWQWVLAIRENCKNANVPFFFKQTGANFKKDNKIYSIERRFQHSQAKKSNIDIL